MVALADSPILWGEPRRAEALMMAVNSNMPVENELLSWRIRVAQLESIVCELLMKNQQLRMALRSAGELVAAEEQGVGL
jgi:hypothetical protein